MKQESQIDDNRAIVDAMSTPNIGISYQDWEALRETKLQLSGFAVMAAACSERDISMTGSEFYAIVSPMWLALGEILEGVEARNSHLVSK